MYVYIYIYVCIHTRMYCICTHVEDSYNRYHIVATIWVRRGYMVLLRHDYYHCRNMDIYWLNHESHEYILMS